jgi:hypothetical protein
LQSLNESNALDVLTLGSLYSSDDLKRAAFNEFLKNYQGKHLSESLINRPEVLKELIEVERNHDREIQASKKRYEEFWTKLNK